MADFLAFRAPSRLWAAGLAGAVLATGLILVSCSKPGGTEDPFIRLMNTGKNYLDQGQPTNAIPVFEQAVKLQPSQPAALLNLANALLAANQAEPALQQAEAALGYDRNLAGAYYVAGCAHLRLRQFEPALQMLQPARDLDPTVAAVHFQIARAHQELGQAEDAMAAYQETIRIETNHPVAFYSLGQLLIRAGQQDEGLKAIERNKEIQARRVGPPLTPDLLEQCKYTVAIAPTLPQKPDQPGIPVTFADATTAAFGAEAARYHGPLGVLDLNHDDRNSLFLYEPGAGFRVLGNDGQGVFKPVGEPLLARTNVNFRRCVIGDFNNDRFEDVLVIGDEGSQLFRFATNGAARDATAASNLRNLNLLASDALALDLDFTGKLDLFSTLPEEQGLRVIRNLGNMYFKDITSTSGVPAEITGVRQVVVDDWNNDDLLDVIVSRDVGPPLYLQKVRGGPLVPTNLPPGQLEGTVLAVGDVNGDSRADLLVGSPGHVDLLLGGINQFSRLPLAHPGLSQLKLVDYDNDGWLDLLAVGLGVQMWRNLGDGQFENATSRLGLDKISGTRVEDVAFADFDQDGDTDIVLSLAEGSGAGLRYLRNDGGNANRQLKLRLFGQRSNASGLGIRIEVASGGFRVHRTVQTLPVEIGVGQREQLDSLTARWFDLAYNEIDVKTDSRNAKIVFEPTLPSGSCPYLYAWDGQTFRFVSDILGSAPLGLRVTDTIFAEADPHEYVWIGDEAMFPPKGDHYVLQLTEELREVLYLDEAKLVVVDHPVGTEVHTTDKFRPGRPFPRGELLTLGNPYPLRLATRLDGSVVTDLLTTVDGRKLSPLQLRPPQLRGLAEPHGVTLDFGPLDATKPLVLVLNGWLRFGGGMANVGASHDPALPFPFPTLEVEDTTGDWSPVDVVVGAPSGKTKTILVDLGGKLRAGAQRLRLQTAFEIHWDRIALLERTSSDSTRIVRLTPDSADLHWRGFSEFADLPAHIPLTPVYDRVFPNPHWTITPTGWCTRYGPANELIAREDNALALLNGGDELTLKFSADRLPPRPEGMVRNFFLYSVGWDKDADFHVELGWKVGPLPWHGMEDQLYGRQPRPAFPTDELTRRYSTRWVPQETLRRTNR